MRDNRLRKAVTLLELLVVVAITGVLIGLLAPAVQQVRGAAVRAQCAANLRQIGIALHNYHDSYRRFPAGVSYQKGQDPFPFMGWHARILPFIEQEPLWQVTVAAYEKDKAWGNPPHIGFGTVIPLYACPADSQAFSQAGPDGAYAAYTSYLGVEGTNQYLKDGILFLDSGIRLTEIDDGSSNTLLAGERPTSSEYVRLGWWYAGYGQNQDGSAEMVLGVREMRFGAYGPQGCQTASPYYFGPGRFENQCDLLHFWSPHAGNGAHFLFADGAVRFLSYSANPIMPALATRAAGDPADAMN